MKKNLILIISVLMFSMLGFSLSSSPAAAQDFQMIKIGALGPLAITPGEDMEKGVKLAVEEINEEGFTVGSQKYKFDLVVKTTSGDDGLPNTEVGVTNLNDLKTSDNVVAIVGGFRTEVVVGLQANLGETPFLGVGSTAPIITPYFYRVGPTNGSILARSLIEFYGFYMAKQGVKQVTIVREDASWTIAIAAGIRGALGPAVLNTTTFTDDIVISTSSSQEQVNSALDVATADGYSDALLTLFSAPIGQQVTQAWASKNMTQYLAGINVEAQKFKYFDDTRGATYGEISLETLRPDQNVTAKTGPFKQAYFDAYGELPTYTSYASYDAIYIIKEALMNAGEVSSSALQAELPNTDYQGTNSRIAFTSEPGSQLGRDDEGNAVPIPGAPDNIIVHDLFTPDSIGTSGNGYANPIMVQWDKGGEKKFVYGSLADINNTMPVSWPIDHSEHGYVEEEGGAGIPGFEMPLFVFSFAFLVAIIQFRKRKN